MRLAAICLPSGLTGPVCELESTRQAQPRPGPATRLQIATVPRRLSRCASLTTLRRGTKGHDAGVADRVAALSEPVGEGVPCAGLPIPGCNWSLGAPTARSSVPRPENEVGTMGSGSRTGPDGLGKGWPDLRRWPVRRRLD